MIENISEVEEVKADEPVRELFLSDAEQIDVEKMPLPKDFFEYERGVGSKIISGAMSGVESIGDIPESVEIFGRRVSYGLGGYFGDDAQEVDRKKQNLITAERNLINQQRERSKYTSAKEADSLSYALGAGAVNYGVMLAGGYVGGLAKVGAAATGIALGAAMELPGQVTDRIKTNEQGEIDEEAMTPEWARKASGGTAVYLASSAILEKYAGFGLQTKMWQKPLKLKNKKVGDLLTAGISGSKSALSEGLTEASQSVLSTGILLADGSIDMNEVPERLRGLWKEAVVGGILGGTAGTAVAINQRANVVKGLKEQLNGVVAPENLDEVANAIYEEGTNDMTVVISKELELDSQLRDGHGAVYESMLSAVDGAVKGAREVGGLTDLKTEDEVAEYVNNEARKFADQTLAEANMRNVPIEEVLIANDIRYEDGKIKFIEETGEKSNKSDLLLQEDVADITTPEFKEWFGDSKVVDEGGNPLVVYHGTDAEFDSFSKEMIGSNTDFGLYGKGFYFANNKNTPYGKKKMAVYLDIKNPFVWKNYNKEQMSDILNMDESWFSESQNGVRLTASAAKMFNVSERLKEKGFDGVVNEMSPSWSEYVAFSPNQIKSVNNKGSFSKDSDNIYYQSKKGSFNEKTKAIELMESADASTLPHELAHYWLDNMFNYVKTGKGSEKYMTRWSAISSFLNMNPEQTRLSRVQQEKWARSYEQYIKKGYAPTPIIGSAMEDYNKFLQRVYKGSQLKYRNEKGKLVQAKLKPETIEFFNSMTTGEFKLPEDYKTSDQLREEIEVSQEKAKQEVVDIVKEPVTQAPVDYSRVKERQEPVTTGGKKGVSRLAKRIADVDLAYDVMNIEDQIKRADELVNSDLNLARDIIDGKKPLPEGLAMNSLTNSYLDKMKMMGNNKEFLRVLEGQSLDATRMGQEIAMLRGQDLVSPEFWINEAMALAAKRVAQKNFSKKDKPIKELQSLLETKSKVAAEKIAQAPVEKRQELAKEAAQDIAEDLGVLYQEDIEIDEALETENQIYKAIYRTAKQQAGLSLTEEQANNIIARAESLQDSLDNTLDETGNPSEQFFRNLSDMQNYLESINPSPVMSVLTSTVGRGNMLMSLKSIGLNIESTAINVISEGIIRRVSMGQKDNYVDPAVIKAYNEYSKNIYKATGYQVSSMDGVYSKKRILNEQIMSSQGEGKIRALGRLYENTIFKYGLGYPDIIAKDATFIDYISLRASKEGGEKGATAIFKDAILLEPQTELGKQIREEAIEAALVATYQNNGVVSDVLLKFREGINKISGNTRIGDLLDPFVKTPANIVGLSLEYSLPEITVAKVLYDAIAKGKPLNKAVLENSKALSRGAIGSAIGFMLASLVDDDDYIPDYSLLSQAERNLIKEKNGVYNSIRIGDKYVSLDYFGTFAMPLVMALEAKRAKNAGDAALKRYAGGLVQTMKLPVINTIADTVKKVNDQRIKTTQEAKDFIQDSLIDFVSARSIPAQITDVVKASDEYIRDTNRSAIDRMISKIAPSSLPEQVSKTTGLGIKTEGLGQILFGARVKSANVNDSVQEIERLIEAGESVTLTDVANRMKVEEDLKPEIRKYFAEEYSKELDELISKPSYERKTDERKADAIRRVRRKALSKTKKEFNVD